MWDCCEDTVLKTFFIGYYKDTPETGSMKTLLGCNSMQYRAFFTSAKLVFQNNEIAAMLVAHTSAIVPINLYSANHVTENDLYILKELKDEISGQKERILSFSLFIGVVKAIIAKV